MQYRALSILALAFVVDGGCARSISLDDIDSRDASIADAPSVDAADAADAATDGGAGFELPAAVHDDGGRSVAKVLVTPTRIVLLEEALASMGERSPGVRRVRLVDRTSPAQASWAPAEDLRIVDVAAHPSGDFSVLLVDANGGVSLTRLDPMLGPRATTLLVDPQFATDPFLPPGNFTTLAMGTLTQDAGKLASVGDDVLIAVYTAANSVILYRLPWTGSAHGVLRRTLVEPALGITPALPIGGSFDTFEAVVSWFRCFLDVDGAGNAYIALWVNRQRLVAHRLLFADSAFPIAPTGTDADIAITKIDPSGARVWTRVVGAVNADEVYALDVGADAVAVVGRTRRFPGDDNTEWDGLLSLVALDGTLRGTRVIDLDVSGLFESVALLADGRIVAGGSEGWSQNPEGLSIVAFGAKSLHVFGSIDAAPVRIALPAGPRNNELRSVVEVAEGLVIAGHEDGPIMHTGDGDRMQIRANGYVGFVAGP